MRILIYGQGWISGIFKEIASSHEVVQGGRVEDVDAVYEEIERLAPTNVISVMGRTHGKGYTTIDYLEQKGKLVENVRDNLYAPLILAEACRRASVHLTYIGTGCIFTYDDDHKIFDEESLPNFFGSSYSTVKGFTDRLMHDLFSTVLNVRIRMPIHSVPNPRNFITKIVNYKKICSVENSMTVFDSLLPILLTMMEEKKVGTVNMTNPGSISHNEILEMYKEIVDPDHTWENFSYEEQSSILLAGRSNNELSTDVLKSVDPEVPHIREAVRDILYKYRDHIQQ